MYIFFKSIIFSLFAFFVFFTLNVYAETTENQIQIDQEKYNKNIQENKELMDSTQRSNTDIDTNEISKDLQQCNKNAALSKKNISDFSPQAVDYNIPLPNANFELGHQYWQELYKSYDGNWYDWDSIIMSGSGGYDYWHAYMGEDDWLISSEFKIPINTKNIYYENDARFVHWGDCSYGTNGIQVAIYDNTSKSVVGTIGFHDAETDEYDYDWYTYYGTLYGVQSRIGHSLTMQYIGYNDDPSCTFALYLDNISLAAKRDDACTNGNCKVYRFQNKQNNTYLFVASENEANSVVYNYGNTFILEGIAYSVPSTGAPMYRFQNKNNGTYLFAGETEKNSILANYSHTFKLEGLAFYTQEGAGLPIYRFRNKSNGTYLFVGESEKDSVLANYSHTFALEGLAFYAAN